MTKQYFAFLSRGGHLVVQPYRGEQDRQEYMRYLRTEIGVYPARDAAHARILARELVGAKR